MLHVVGGLLVGGAAGAAATKVTWRRVLKGAIREGIRLGRSAKALGADVMTETAHLVEEARTELDGARHTESNS